MAYGAAVALRNGAYDRGWRRQVKLPCRVVSVGNLTVGGTGKTACVELITRKLTASGRHVAILSRGYGGARRDYWLRWEGGRLEINGEPGGGSDGLADEPQLLARHLKGVPILVGPRRDRTGQLACESFGVDTVVLDDGFQHRQLQRDCDVVLIHARMPFSGWPLLPRGPMREPLTALKRAQVIVLTKADEALETLGALSERLRSFSPEAAIMTAVHEPSSLEDPLTGRMEGPQYLSGRQVGLVSSIGDPEGFEATIRRLHATVKWHQAFPDHHRYQPGDWTTICDHVARSPVDALVTTEKDWVRFQTCPMSHVPCPTSLWVLSVRMKVLSGEHALDDRLARLYAR